MRTLKNILIGLVIAVGLLGLTEGALTVAGIEEPGRSYDLRNRYDPEGRTVTLPLAAARGIPSTVMFHATRNPFTQVDPDYIFRVRPNLQGGPVRGYSGINALGFRGRDPEAAGQSGDAMRILVLGGSCAFGFRIRDHRKTWPYLVEQRLKAAGQPAEVYNLGQPGHSSTQARLLFEEWAPVVKPDVVIIYVGWNDMWPTELLTDSETIRLLKIKSNPVIRFLTELRLYRVVEKGLGALSGAPDTLKRSAGSRRRIRVPLKQVEQNISAMSSGVRTILVPPPYAPIKRSLRSIDRFNALVRKVFADRVEFVAAAAMRPDRAGARAYFADGLHPNERGAAYLADEIARIILAKPKGT